MDYRLILIVILSMLPLVELRGGLPLGIIYANEQGIPIIFTISLAILANILVVFVAFYFLDKVHCLFLRNKTYKRLFEAYAKRTQKKVDSLKEKYLTLGFLALAIFVAIPLPGTGAWTGVFISWILGLDRKKSILSISLGVIGAGIIVTLATLGIINLLV